MKHIISGALFVISAAFLLHDSDGVKEYITTIIGIIVLQLANTIGSMDNEHEKPNP